MTPDLLGFLVVVSVAYLIPGPDFLVVTRFAARHPSLGHAAAIGAQVGLCLHMLLAVLGLSAIAAHSATAFSIVKWIGAAYLITLGCRTFLSGFDLQRLKADDRKASRQRTDPSSSYRSAFRTGLLTNVLNPKAALFFVSVLPQFIDDAFPAGPQILMLGIIDIAVGVVYWLALVGLVRQTLPRLGRSRMYAWRNQITGLLLAGAGALLLRTSGDRL